MPIRRKARRELEIEMGPLCDVAFLLIIFFIVATTLVKPEGKVIDIPSATSEKQQKESKNLTVNVLPGEIRFGEDESNTQVVTYEAFRADLARRNLPTLAQQQRMIVVNIAEGVPFDAFYKVVTAIAQAGGIVTLVEEETEGSS